MTEATTSSKPLISSSLRYVVRRLAVSMPIFVLLEVVMAVCSMHLSILQVFSLFLGSVLIAQGLILKHEKTIEPMLDVTWLIAMGSAIILSVILFATTYPPSAVAATHIANLLNNNHVLELIITFVICRHFFYAMHLGKTYFQKMFGDIVKLTFLYSLTLWIIGLIGNDIYQWIDGNKADAISLLTLALIASQVIKFSTPENSYKEDYYGNADKSLSMARGVTATPPVSKQDERYIVAHEIAHLLPYAALDSLPENLKVTINENPISGQPLGSVTGLPYDHRLVESETIEWHMLVFLAGKVGEIFAHGHHTMGSTEDHTKWQRAARQYLSVNTTETYFIEPQNDFENNHNLAKMAELKEWQLEQLNALFEINKDIFNDLTKELQEKRKLDLEQLAPFLGKVILPSGFPRPSGQS